MQIYYAIYYKSVVPVYRIKEGWIPVVDYRENSNDEYYIIGNRDMYCIAVWEKDIYEDVDTAIKKCKEKIEKMFIDDINRLFNQKIFDSEALNNLIPNYEGK